MPATSKISTALGNLKIRHENDGNWTEVGKRTGASKDHGVAQNAGVF